MKKVLIIGGGIGGCISALELEKKGWDVTLVDAAKELGAGLRTRFIGGHPYTFGPRHFLTHNTEVYEYLDSIVPLRRCAEHQFLSYIEQDRNFYSYPIHFDDIPRMPEALQIEKELEGLEARFRDNEYRLTQGDATNGITASDYKDFWIKSIGPTLYEKFIGTYSRKMWQLEDESIIDDFTWSPKGVAIKRGQRAGWDTAISAYPIAADGYNKIFDLTLSKVKCVMGERISSIDPITKKTVIRGEKLHFDVVINTVPLDDIFENCHGRLNFVGRDIQYIVLPIKNALPEDVYFTYYCGGEKYTRVTEYKKFTKHNSEQTLISIESPSSNGRYYPLPVASQREIAKKYLGMLGDGFYSIGRLGLYNYRYDIDDVVEQSLEVVRSV
ncbi:FAD-dependent oxidoreductase [Polynucleobacter sp. MWH-UH23A]|uniref:FAD-dependent oxidoreductase n=1 Tax=Polynucleobacter sp. MWH-UH23A TaxID=1855613 RepID=UPI003364E255